MVSIVRFSSDLGEFAFSPNPVVIHFGEQVVWKNNDGLSHMIVGEAKEGICAFKSDTILAGREFIKIFNKRAVCDYYCGIHGRDMRGRVIVK